MKGGREGKKGAPKEQNTYIKIPVAMEKSVCRLYCLCFSFVAV